MKPPKAGLQRHGAKAKDARRTVRLRQAMAGADAGSAETSATEVATGAADPGAADPVAADPVAAGATAAAAIAPVSDAPAVAVRVSPVASADLPEATSSDGVAAAMTAMAAPDTSARALLASVFLLGTLVTLLGSVLPVWGYHRLDEFVAAGNHFLLLGVGFLVSNVLAARSASRYPRFIDSPLPGASMALLGLLVFAFLPPPFPIQVQLGGAFAIGLAMGALNATIFLQFGALAALRSSAAFHLASVFGLLGAAVTPLAVALVVTPSNSLALLVLAPAPLLVGLTLRTGRRAPPPSLADRSLREALADFRSPPAVLLTLLLLFQLGNEMAMFGWLPVFLIQRLGVSPSTALYGLATFSLALLAGRVAVQAMARHALRNRLVLSGLSVALLGCSMLAITNNLFGALLGAVLCGVGFAPIYPAALELIGRRFPYFHPGVFNSIFSIGFVGALLAPWSLGLLNHALGIQTVMVLPVFGLLLVALILGLLWLEAKLTGGLR